MSTENTGGVAPAPAEVAPPVAPPVPPAPAPPVSAPVVQAPPPPPAPPAPAEEPYVRVPLANYQYLEDVRQKHEKSQAEIARAAREKEEAVARHMAEQGKWKEALDKQKADKDKEIEAERQRAQLMEQQTKQWVLDGELSR